MSADDDLYALSGQLDMRFEMLGGKVPVVLVDNFYQKPDDVREKALGLTYKPPSYAYPGKLAEVQADPSLDTTVRWVWEAANWQFLTRVPIRPEHLTGTA